MRVAESKLREKNAGLPAANDKAGGEQVNGKEHGHIGWLSRNRAGKLDMLTDLEIDASNGEWSRLFKLYTHPQPQAEVRVPEHRSSLCIHPVCGTTCCDCNSAISARDQTKYAMRYAYLRSRDLNAIHDGGVFAGMTPSNVVLNGDDLDAEIDIAMLAAAPKHKDQS